MPFELIEKQQKTHWCWAAVAQSVARYYMPDKAWTQCGIVKTALNLDSCCDHPDTNEECDRDEHLEDALDAIGCKYEAVEHALPFEQVRSEIDADRPVCARIEWPDRTGHFVIISGYRVMKSGRHQVMVQDPQRGASWRGYVGFQKAYRLTGRWTATFMMKENS